MCNTLYNIKFTIMKKKYIAGLSFFFLPLAMTFAQIELSISGQKNGGEVIKTNSIINYTDLCSFSFSSAFGNEFSKNSWYINIYEKKIGNKSVIKYAEVTGTDSNKYSFSFSQLFDSEGEPQLTEGYYWDMVGNTNLIYAEIVCEAVTKTGETVNASFPVYLHLAPDKPIIEILRIEETMYDNYIIEFFIHDSPTSAPREKRQFVLFSTEDGILILPAYENYYYCDNLFFESDLNYFCVEARNSFGRTESDYIYPRTYSAIKTLQTDNFPFIFPNKVRDVLYIHRQKGENYTSDISIFDMTGRLVKNCRLPIEQIMAVEVGDLPFGSYFLYMKGPQEENYILRFIKSSN